MAENGRGGKLKILIVDDSRAMRLALRGLLEAVKPEVITEAASLAEARECLETEGYDLALVDVRLSADPSNRDGLQLVEELKRYPQTRAVVVSGSNQMAEVRAAMRAGAYDYILKDELCAELVIPVVQSLAARQRLEREVVRLRASQSPEDPFEGMVGDTPPMVRLRSAIARAASSDRPVLVTGPTGSGKELVVRALHVLGPNAGEPLIDVNCGALPEHLIESHLFGHEKGSFTGADRRHDGYFSAVGRGTLFLDELAELPLLLQSKLLRVLETGAFRRVGSNVDQRFEGRVIAATHAELPLRVAAGTFREDLLYRLNVLELVVPSLQERREDIPRLIAHFVRLAGDKVELAPDALDALCARAWPGNVRQLRNLIERLSVFCTQRRVTLELLEQQLGNPGKNEPVGTPGLFADAILRLAAPNKLEAASEYLIQRAMALAEGNKSQAARLLGVHRKVIERRLSGEPQGGDPEPEG